MAMPPRSRLGRGLSTLINGTDPLPSNLPSNEPSAGPAGAGRPADASGEASHRRVDSTAEVPLDRIDVNPRQPRRAFDEAALAELAGSIKANGVIQPVVVRPVGDRYELIAGERRLRAARLAGLAALPVVIRPVDDYTQAQWALVENIHRADLNPVERAEAYAALMQSLGLTQAELAGRLGEQRSSVANYLRLLDLAGPVRELVRTGQLSLGHAKVLAGVAAHEDQALLATQCVEEAASVRELERMAAMLTGRAPREEPYEPSDAADDRQAHYAELEQQLVQHLGVRVQLRRGRKSGTGQIVLHYANLDQFDDLVKRWGITLDQG
jgi:ParB family transcriptional regulator, chromosome partitioning protein